MDKSDLVSRGSKLQYTKYTEEPEVQELVLACGTFNTMPDKMDWKLGLKHQGSGPISFNSDPLFYKEVQQLVRCLLDITEDISNNV